MRSLRPLLLCLVFAFGCQTCEDIFDGGSSPDLNGGVGESCDDSADCRSSLVCAADNTCQGAGTGTEGSACQLTADCGPDLYCGSNRTCTASGATEEGGDCTTTGDCTQGLVCVFEGFGGRCRASGAGDLGDPCNTFTDCLAGLSCTPGPDGGNQCSSPPAMGGDGGGAPTGLPLWAGETCTPDEGASRAFFDVPRGGGMDGDFYRLPFPNDTRRDVMMNLDLTGHPSPGTVVPTDIIDLYLRASEEDLDGFATNPVVFFRFSRPYDWDSTADRFRMIDVTPGSPDYGMPVLISWLTTVGPITRYMCPDWFAISTPPGVPLRPGNTYAAILDNGITDDTGAAFARSPDFDAVMGSSPPPSDAALVGAWNAYTPLRDWLSDSMTDPSGILNAAVFTTQTFDDIVPALRQNIRTGTAPVVTDLTACADGVTSPCDDGTPERACNPDDPSFLEIHGRIALPIYQQGTAPYETPEDGGGIERNSGGAPTRARAEDVCFALTVPRGVAPPAEGFPLMVAGHGTGGSFTGAVRNGLAAEVSNGNAGGMPVQAATLSIDFPQHGERRGGATRDPSRLFFNFANPRAARDNITQGSADLLSLVYWATGYSQLAATSPSMQDIRFDPTRIVFYMHSQGATHASLMIHHEPDLAAVVLSGNGGDLTESLLNKTQPVDIAGILPFALLDVDGAGNLPTGAFHPVLALFQAYFERVDPVNYGRRLWREPLAGATGLHVFMTYGLGDTYSPEPTMRAYGLAARFTQATPVLESFGLPEGAPPVMGNVQVNMTPFTMGLRQYMPTGMDDGHFVAFRTSQGLSDTSSFALTALAGMPPSVGR